MVEESHEQAPGALRRVQDFINTEDLDHHTDDLDSPEKLASWLTTHGLLETGGRADAGDLGLAREVRAALRDLALANNDGPLPAVTWEILNRTAAEAGLQVLFGPGGGQVVAAADGVIGGLGRLLIDVFTAMEDGTWPRLKACRDDSCRWAFYDRSKNRSGAWCSMAACGNRAKTRAYRRRSKGSPERPVAG